MQKKCRYWKTNRDGGRENRDSAKKQSDSGKKLEIVENIMDSEN